MIKKIYLLTFVASMLLMASCSSKMGPLSADYFTVTPSPLEAVGNEVPVTVNGRFPQKFFKKNAILTVTPVLVWNGGQEKAESYIFEGENVEGNNRKISYKEGGNFVMKSSFNYRPEMAKSELYLQFSLKVKSKTTTSSVKVADGVVSTAQLYKGTVTTATTATGEDAFQRVIKQAKEANIMFLIQQANLRQSELGSVQVQDFNAKLKDLAENNANQVIENVEVFAYASPDGSFDLNRNLADNRGTNAERYVAKQVKKSKLDTPIDTRYSAEDWEGFQELVSKSNLADKELILRVLSMYDTPEEREAQIKNISSAYQELAETILPQLRRARLTINYQFIGRSDEEIMAAFAADPSQLSVEELLYAATLTDDEALQTKIFNTTSRLYPNDYRSYNNLAQMAYAKGDMATAEKYLKQAAQKNAAAAEVNTNLGLLALSRGEVEAAETYMAKGANSSVANEAQGNLYLAQGLYDRAEVMFGDQASNSAALAQLLNKNYAKARTTLDAIKTPDADTYYLKAVLGARTDNAALLCDGLKNAVKLDSSLAQKAQNDLEFTKYLNTASFINALK